ncbi:hypothetical protein M3Y99_00835800 [Aphelenchoides fujianensis]|nr:hypothetical protein M3Y99_00835800 [Aphelenchoides fujianensis]
MTHNQLPSFLSVEEVEHVLSTIEITLQCREVERQLMFRKQMAFVLHVQLCRRQSLSKQAECQVENCGRAKKILEHALHCADNACGVKLCLQLRQLIRHYEACSDVNCGICTYASVANNDRYFLYKSIRLFSSNSTLNSPPSSHKQAPSPSDSMSASHQQTVKHEDSVC